MSDETPTPEDWAWYTGRLAHALRRAAAAEDEILELRTALDACAETGRAAADAWETERAALRAELAAYRAADPRVRVDPLVGQERPPGSW